MRRTMIPQMMTSNYVMKTQLNIQITLCQSSPKCIVIFSFIAKVLFHQLCFINLIIIYLIIPHSHVATIMLPCCCLAALILPPPLLCCRRRFNASYVRRRVTTKLPTAPLPPCCHPCHHHHQHCQPATTSTKLPPSLLSKLQDKFDNEKEFCNNADIDCIQFLDYSDLASNSCMGGCIQYSTPQSICHYIVIIFKQINRFVEI